MDRIICPFHEEKTPSLVVYPDGFYHCFGCGRHGPARDLGIRSTGGEKYVEDVKATLEYIRSLPNKLIRGLNLPYDEGGYFVVWPDCSYYKRRRWGDNPGGCKYKGPSGHTKPLFKAQITGSKTLIVAEGEINALSLGLAYPELDVVSPGSAGDFVANRVSRDLDLYKTYSKIVVVADEDRPGACGAIEFKSVVREFVPNTVIKLLRPDANEILVTRGKDALRHEIENLAMPTSL